MKTIYLIACISLISIGLNAQKYQLAKSKISFFSSAPMEDIAAYNEETKSILDLEQKTFAFSVPIHDFQFRKKLMQEHFNENYLESEKYPKAYFQGKIEAYDSSKDKQEIVAKGVLTIHGVSQQVAIASTLAKHKNKVNVSAKFNVKIEDYEIEVPQIVVMNIAEIVEVTVAFEYEKM